MIKMNTSPNPTSTPTANWLESEKKEFERVMRPQMPEADFARGEQGDYTGEVHRAYVGWIKRARKALDDAIGASGT